MPTRTEITTLAFAVVSLAIGAGCSPAGSTPPVRSARGWETRELAPGVQLRIGPDASPGARQAAEGLEDEYRSTYLNSR